MPVVRHFYQSLTQTTTHMNLCMNDRLSLSIVFAALRRRSEMEEVSYRMKLSFLISLTS